MSDLRERLTPQEWARWERCSAELTPSQHLEALGHVLGYTQGCKPGTGILPEDLESSLVLTKHTDHKLDQTMSDIKRVLERARRESEYMCRPPRVAIGHGFIMVSSSHNVSFMTIELAEQFCKDLAHHIETAKKQRP